jgi:hypothetical protein
VQILAVHSDVGDYLLEGRVLDEHANPIAGAQLSSDLPGCDEAPDGCDQWY